MKIIIKNHCFWFLLIEFHMKQIEIFRGRFYNFIMTFLHATFIFTFLFNLGLSMIGLGFFPNISVHTIVLQSWHTRAQILSQIFLRVWILYPIYMIWGLAKTLTLQMIKMFCTCLGNLKNLLFISMF